MVGFYNAVVKNNCQVIPILIMKLFSNTFNGNGRYSCALILFPFAWCNKPHSTYYGTD